MTATQIEMSTTMDLRRITAFDTAMWSTARGQCMGRLQLAVCDGSEPYTRLGDESWANLKLRWTHAGIIFAVVRDAAQLRERRERIIFGDVPGAPKIEVDDHGVTLGTARRARMRWVAAAEEKTVEREERIERVRRLVDTMSIMECCDPLGLAAHTRFVTDAQVHIEVLRGNVEDYYADRIDHGLFCAKQEARWGLIVGEHAGTQEQVRVLLARQQWVPTRPKGRDDLVDAVAVTVHRTWRTSRPPNV